MDFYSNSTKLPKIENKIRITIKIEENATLIITLQLDDDP
jgi:hypothetical protein